MNDRVPVVAIQTKNGPVEINFTDYDPSKHKLAVDTEAKELKPLDPSEKEALFGSSVQPAIFLLKDGSTMQLGDVVRTAFERSGLTVEKWNKLAQDKREKLIADVVAELLPPDVNTYVVGKKAPKRGQPTKFIIYTADGKPVGEEEFDTKEAADAHLDVLKAGL